MEQYQHRNQAKIIEKELIGLGMSLLKNITPGSRAGLEPRSGVKSVAVQPIVNHLNVVQHRKSLIFLWCELAILLAGFLLTCSQANQNR